ncbi:hypothetical protein N2603_36805 [Bradyrhizobium huanghuaihaiense]|uniref:hypothetical protein n=1 Tax=Bradyrhizobium huanghuaihaiense TaxID=990078 RepID=UPI0021AA96F5|nr:hypothetical protein [Bradyrhizobium sp. CB3035]UWU75523.1 hypothetical protein N2603_36805 [Bradyrhizobium sp. CB3035]
MISDQLAAMRTRRNRIHRYRHLLETNMTGLERQYLERRLSEELLLKRADDTSHQ